MITIGMNFKQQLMDIRTLGMLILQCNVKSFNFNVFYMFTERFNTKSIHLRCINVKWGFVYYFDIMLLTSVLGEREKSLSSCLGL